MLSEIGADELLEWEAYSILEPFGEYRADLRMGITASVIANCQRTKKSKAFKPKDFIPKFGPPIKQDPSVMKEILMALVSASKNKKKPEKKVAVEIPAEIKPRRTRK